MTKLRIIFIPFAFLSLLLSFSISADETMEEVVVMGKPIKASQQSAIEAKRLADNVADIISADAVGRFPDQNLADALGRIPGMGIERDQGQARYVSFRGSPKRYTTTAFNGIDVPGVENGRIPRFDAYPSVITSQVVANKAITADMPGESVSGYIDVKTFQPGDIEGFNLSAEVGFGEQDLGGGNVDKANLRMSFSNESFGVLLYGSSNGRKQVTDNREFEYVGGPGQLIPEQIEYRNYLLDREDKAFGGTVEFYLENGGKAFVSTTNTEFTDREERNHWYFYFPSGAAANTGTTDLSVRRLLQDGNTSNETNVHTIGFESSINDWDFEVSYSDIETKSSVWLPLIFLNAKGGDPEITNATYNVSNGLEPIISFDEDLNAIDFPTRIRVDAVGGLDIENDQFKFDASKQNKWGELKLGFKYDSRDAAGGGTPLETIGGGLSLTVDEVRGAAQGPWNTQFNNDIGVFYADNRGLGELMRQRGLTRPDYSADETLVIEEQILSAYAMQTIDMDWGNIILGLRVEDTEYETIGQKLVGAVAEPLSVKQSYTNVLPSAHVNWDFKEDQKLRFSFSTGISRPTYIEARASASISEISESITGGNPFLEEETSWGIDIAWEWYYNEASILSLTAFHRSIDNVIAEETLLVDGSLYSSIADPGDLWSLTGFGNGDDGRLQGIELNYIGRLDNYVEGFFSGFGLEANFTVIDSEYTAPSGLDFRLPGQSDLTYNVSLFYEDHGLSARLSYRYRDAWQDETETGAVFEFTQAIFWDEQSRLDLSIRYDLEPLVGYKASVFLDMNNLTDENDSRYAAERWNPTQNEYYGRRYLAGIRFSL